MAPVFMMPQKTMSQVVRGVVGNEGIQSSLLIPPGNVGASDDGKRREREQSIASIKLNSDSPGSDQSAKKRKRASKPKVRTGCITW
jgi:hypothetical protein